MEARPDNYTLVLDRKNDIHVCYDKRLSGVTGLWKAENPLESSLYLLVLQLVLIMSFNHIIMYLIRPLRQPRIVADILGGVMLGPSVLGANHFARKYVVPFSTMLSLETVANLGLVYYMFLVGLELDFRPVIRAGKKAMSIAVAGILVSVPVGWVLHYYLLQKDTDKVWKQKKWDDTAKQLLFEGPMFWGVALATTNFADLARILADLKLLHSEIGRVALSAAVISDLFSWFLLMLAIAVVSINWVIVVSTLAFIGFLVFLVRPALDWLLRNKSKEEHFGYNELHIGFILSGIVLCGFATDACGSHSIVGPFVLGAIMPKGLELKNILVETVGNMVSGLLMPLLYLVVGLRTHMAKILNDETDSKVNGTTMSQVVLVIITAFAAKIVATFAAALCNKMTPRDGLVIGFLMNTKGLMALIIISSGRDLKALDQQTFAVMIVAIWVMTVPVGPVLALTYKNNNKHSPEYKLRNIQSLVESSDDVTAHLRILACTYASSNTSGMIDLIEASNPTEHSPIHVFAAQLVELTGHASAMLIVHDACRPNSNNNNVGSSEVSHNFTSNAFENYSLQRKNVSVQSLTVVSSYSSMHEDICNLAQENRVNLIIMPFHEKSAIDGEDHEYYSNPYFMAINKNVIDKSPCSVAVFVDRGLAPSKIPINSSNNNSNYYYYKFAMLFLGGKDDREALSYAWRMASHPGVHLTVIVILSATTTTTHDHYSAAGGESLRVDDVSDIETFGGTMATSRGRQKQLDDYYLNEFRLKSMGNPAIQLLEERVNSWEETHSFIRTMEGEYDLCIVGRGNGRILPFQETTLLDSSDDSDEFGLLGDALVSSRCMTNTSILVMKQGTPLEEINLEDKMGCVEEELGHTTWQPPAKTSSHSVIETTNL